MPNSPQSTDHLLTVLERVVPSVIEALMRNRAEERAHELALLDKDREYAMARLESKEATGWSPEMMNEIVARVLQAMSESYARATPPEA
jgi:hypothetical protein